MAVYSTHATLVYLMHTHISCKYTYAYIHIYTYYTYIHTHIPLCSSHTVALPMLLQ